MVENTGELSFNILWSYVKDQFEYIHYIVELVPLRELTKLQSAFTRQNCNAGKEGYLKGRLNQLLFPRFFCTCDARTRLCNHGLKGTFLENMIYDATPSYCCIVTVLQISFPSFYFKYK